MQLKAFLAGYQGPSLKNVPKTLAKSLLTPLRLTAVASVVLAGIYEKMYESVVIH